MFCWWCTAMRNWRHGGTRWGIQGPVVHFYCQDWCDNYITSWDNLETSFPSALKLVAVFPFWSLGKERIWVESNGGGAEHTIMYWYAAGTRKPFLKVPTVTASSKEATCRYLYKYINYPNYTLNRMCDTDILLDFYPGSNAMKVKHYHNHLQNLIAISQCLYWNVFLFHLRSTNYGI